MSFKIIVDSCCDLTPAMLRGGAFTRVPLTIRVDGDVFVDEFMMARLRPPKTIE